MRCIWCKVQLTEIHILRTPSPVILHTVFAFREFGLARKTVCKMLEYSLPPGYRRQKPIRRPKLGPWVSCYLG